MQLNQTCFLQSAPLHSRYTAPNVFCSSGTRPGTCFAGWHKGPVSNFLLSPLPSEIGDLLWGFQLRDQEKVRRVQIWKVERHWNDQTAPDWLWHGSLFVHPSADATKILWQHDASSVCRSKSGGMNFYRFLLLGQLHGQLGDDFDESQQALSQRDRRPLMWKAIQIWGRLRWTFCPIWNAGTIRDNAYGSNNPLHEPVATSEKPP